jgi:CBS domain containing-hemolysin-like protein
VDSETIFAIALLVIGVIALMACVAAETGVIIRVREHAMREPEESRLDALRRFYHERQITLSSLALARNLAVVGVTAVAVFLISDLTGHSWTALLATTLGVLAIIVILQALPKIIVAKSPARWQRLLRPFSTGIRFIFRAPAALLDAPVDALARAWHAYPRNGEGELEEQILLTELDDASAALEEGDRQMIRGVMEMEFRSVREVMIPRTDITALEISEGFDRVAEMMVEEGYSRIPVFEENIDNIVGVAHAKEVLKRLARGEREPDLRTILRPAHHVPESKKVHEMLTEMRERQISIAIAVDEYGGTAGLVTVEDLLEEIVGEIRDEYDIEEQSVQLVTPTEAIVDARLPIEELSEMFDLEIEKDLDFDSIGGFIVNELGRMPNVGDQVGIDGIRLKVLSITGRRVKKVRVTRVGSEAESTPA